MAQRSVTFDFFTLKSNNLAQLEIALKKELTLRSNNTVNNVKVFDFYARIRDIKNTNNVWIGNVENLNVLDQANIGDIGGGRQAVATKADQGPLFDTIFLYNPLNSVIVLHRNRSGLGVTSFTKYLSELVNDEDLVLEIIIDPDTLIRLDKMALVQNFEYNISKPTNYTFAKEGARSLHSDLELLKLFSGEKMKVVIGSEKGKKLTRDIVIKKVKALLSNETANVTKLDVKGYIDGEVDTLDLIKNRVIHTKKFNLKKGQKVTDVMLIDAVEEAYNKHRTNLNRMYINKKD